MHVYDVEEVIRGNDRCGLQQAFRVLVAYPRLGHIEGVHSAARLDELLDDVLSALLVDDAIMPEALVETLHEVTSRGFEPKPSYAQGAMVVFECRDRWRLLFTAEERKSHRAAA